MKIEFNIPDLVDLKKTYDEDGYNHIPELFSSSDMDILNKEFERYIKDCVPKMKEQEVYYVDKSNKDSLFQMQKEEKSTDVAIIRLEQIYPFPHNQFEAIMKKYAGKELQYKF